MADERLERGRNDLKNGQRALRLGFVEEGERYFKGALMRFRSPELRLGEAHSLRGLAEVALTNGDLGPAEARARLAIDAYAALPSLVDAFADLGAADSPTLAAVLSGARDGEVASLALLGDILSRSGRSEESEVALGQARARLGPADSVAASAGVHMTSGRIDRRAGRVAKAAASFEQAADLYRQVEQLDGVVFAHLLLAEVHTGQGAIEPAYHALHAARGAARELEEPGLEARVLCALGEVALGARHDVEAGSYFDDALIKAREAGDLEREAQALVGRGSVAGHMGDPTAVETIFEGIQSLARSQRHAGMAGALLRLGNRARRISAPRLALICSEVARRLVVETDPVRGQGQALRTQVKALAQLQRPRATLMAAFARRELAGHVQPNANEVADWYADRSAPEVVDEVGAMQVDALLAGVTAVVEEVLATDLGRASLTAADLSDPVAVLPAIALLVQDAHEARGPTRLSVQSLPGTSSRAPTEVPAGERVVVDAVEEPTELTDSGTYQSLDDMYGSLYET